eukprot:CAMPEP_0168578950 /NCGR_PEP_ID=MMETSP0413-20121227/21603_1 /TAXON_ID=136452 /ORGANISM="Filamoeba nolandi, Strain NC-AS-23-1" /LENGTH=855 /DNA_ID=CAMNT_0008612825 /DNA_START=39 /DNA_END=2607 /DNA_ORIENTATION=-
MESFEEVEQNFRLLQSECSTRTQHDVSAQQGFNMKELMDKIRSYGNLIMKNNPNSGEIPKFYADMFDKLQEVSANKLLVHRKQIVELCDNAMTETCLTYLHNIGTIIYQKSSQMICSHPNVLIRLLSCFICQSESHKNALFGTNYNKKRMNSSIVKKEDLEEELKGYIQHISAKQASPLLSVESVGTILSMLESFGLFYRLSPEVEQLYKCEGYIFPSLRDKGTFKLIDFGALIRYAAASSQEIQKTLQDSNVDVNALLYQNQFGGFDDTIENSEGITFKPQLTIACRIQFRDQRVISPHFFFQFQIQTKEAHDIRSQLYANGFRINDKYGNHAVILHDPKSRAALIVIQGFTPLSLLLEIKKELWSLYDRFYLHTFPVVRMKPVSPDSNNNNATPTPEPEANAVQANLVLEIQKAKEEEQIEAIQQMLDFDDMSPFLCIYVCPACIIRLSPGEIDYLHPEFVDCHSFHYDLVNQILFQTPSTVGANANNPTQALTETRVCTQNHRIKVYQLVWGYFDAEFVMNAFGPLMHSHHIMNRPYNPYHASHVSAPTLYQPWEVNSALSLFDHLIQKHYSVWYQHMKAAVLAQPLQVSFPVDSSNSLVLGQPGPAFTRVPIHSVGLLADEYEEVQKWFRLGLQNTHSHYIHDRIVRNWRPIGFELVGAERIINPTLFLNFQKKFHELKNIGRNGEELKMFRFFHATNSEKNINAICENGLLPYGHKNNPCENHHTDGGFFGDTRKGIYLSRYSEYTFHYANGGKPLRTNKTVKVLMCLTLPGKSNHILAKSPKLDPTPGYDSHVSPQKIEVFLFDPSQCCPMYVLEIKAVPATFTADEGLTNPHIQYVDSEDENANDQAT